MGSLRERLGRPYVLGAALWLMVGIWLIFPASERVAPRAIDDTRVADSAGSLRLDAPETTEIAAADVAAERSAAEERIQRERDHVDAPRDDADPKESRPRAPVAGAHAPRGRAGTAPGPRAGRVADSRTSRVTGSSSTAGGVPSGSSTGSGDPSAEPSPEPTPDVLPPGTGLRGEYWDFDSELTKVPNLDLSGANLVRLDPLIDFNDPNWNVPFQPLETFAVCWRGYFRAADDGHYAFVVGSDDGALLEIDNVPICGNDQIQGYAEARGELDLVKGLHVLKLRYFQNRGAAVCRLLYATGTSSPVIIPTELLYPAGSGVEAGRPIITAVAPLGAKRGESITLTGANFSEVPGLDKVTFGQVPAVVTAATASTLEVVIPDGVDQGPISVQVGDQVAPGIAYTVGGLFGLVGKIWRAPAGEVVASYQDVATAGPTDDEQLVGPLDIPSGAAFNLTFDSLFFRAAYVGRFFATTSGEHGFSLDSDDGSRLLIDGQMVVDDSGLHARTHAAGTMFLAQGAHEIEVDFYQHGGDANLTLGHSDPGGPPSVCPRGLLAPPLIYDTAVLPVISGLSPASCGPGDQVTINGQGFTSPDSSPVRAFVGSVELKVLSSSPSSLLALVPASGVATGPLVVRSGPFASAPVTLTIVGQGLKAEIWNIGAPLSTLPTPSKDPDITRIDGPIDFQEDSAFQVTWTPADYFAIRWTGQLSIPTDGSYELCVGSDDGSRLIVDGQTVVENDGVHPYIEVANTITLTAGLHPMTLLFFENEGDARCRLLWTVPGGPGRVVVPRANLVPAN